MPQPCDVGGADKLAACVVQCLPERKVLDAPIAGAVRIAVKVSVGVADQFVVDESGDWKNVWVVDVPLSSSMLRKWVGATNDLEPTPNNIGLMCISEVCKELDVTWKQFVVIVEKRHPLGCHHRQAAISVFPCADTVVVDSDHNRIRFSRLIQHARDCSVQQQIRTSWNGRNNYSYIASHVNQFTRQ